MCGSGSAAGGPACSARSRRIPPAGVACAPVIGVGGEARGRRTQGVCRRQAGRRQRRGVRVVVCVGGMHVQVGAARNQKCSRPSARAVASKVVRGPQEGGAGAR